MYAKVIVGLNQPEMDKLFDYRIPEGMTVEIGVRVIVPFGSRNKKAEGYVISLSEKTEVPADKIKELLEVLDEGRPTFTPALLDLAEWMKELNEKGEYKIGTELQNKILKDFFGTWVDEVETRETIGDVYNNYGYVMDPHTAVAYKAMEKYRLMTGDETYSIVLSTASPFKFNDVVLASIDPDTYEGKALDPFVAMDDLSRLAKMPIPAGMQELSKLQKRQSDVVDKTRMEAEVKKLLGLE